MIRCKFQFHRISKNNSTAKWCFKTSKAPTSATRPTVIVNFSQLESSSNQSITELHNFIGNLLSFPANSKPFSSHMACSRRSVKHSRPAGRGQTAVPSSAWDPQLLSPHHSWVAQNAKHQDENR